MRASAAQAVAIGRDEATAGLLCGAAASSFTAFSVLAKQGRRPIRLPSPRANACATATGGVRGGDPARLTLPLLLLVRATRTAGLATATRISTLLFADEAAKTHPLPVFSRALRHLLLQLQVLPSTP